MSKVKIPKQVFVVSTKREEVEYIPPDYTMNVLSVHNLGFLHAHEPGKTADDKRKKTQMDWAYRGETYKRGDEWWERGVDHSWTPSGSVRTPYDRPIDPLYTPKVWENEPLDGFKIIDTVNRYRGNKLFKVLDPRGIEFEITVAALHEIIQMGTIEKGVIMQKCLWKSGKVLMIAPLTTKTV